MNHIFCSFRAGYFINKGVLDGLYGRFSDKYPIQKYGNGNCTIEIRRLIHISLRNLKKMIQWLRKFYNYHSEFDMF